MKRRTLLKTLIAAPLLAATPAEAKKVEIMQKVNAENRSPNHGAIFTCSDAMRVTFS